MELFAEHHAKERLLDKLDQSLVDHAKTLSSGDGPQIVDVYRMQGLAEVHCYLKTVHQFDPSEVEDLLQFADPLEAAHICWEENPHEYNFPICDLLRETQAKERLPLAEPEKPQRASVRDQLRAAMKEARQQSVPERQTKGGEAR